MNINNQLPEPLTPGNGFNGEMDWEIDRKRNKRKQCKGEKKNAGRTKAKPDAMMIRKKDPNVTFASVLKLMKDKVDKGQAARNINKIRQTKTGDLLIQLQSGRNAKHLKETVTTAIGSEATVLQLSQQVALDVRDMDMDTTEGEVQAALAETARVPVEALKVKAMRPMYGGMQMAIVTILRMNALRIIKSWEVRIGWVIARGREKISVSRCFRCSTFGHLSATWSSEPVYTQCEAMGVDHRHRSGSAKCTALAKAKERRQRKGNG